MRVQNWIIEWFVENTFAEKADLLQGLDNNYIDYGWLDSMGFITFLIDIESEFGIEFDGDAFQDQEFFTIEGLSKILDELT